MTDVKAAIQVLCSTLNILLRTNLTPEYCRSAKFDKDDQNAIQELWTVLQKLLYVVGPDISCSKDDIHLKIKLQLAAHGYNSIAMYALPSDCSKGARELLLALAWLVAEEDALFVATNQRLKYSFLCKEFVNDAVIKGHETSNTSALSTPFSDESDQLNYLLWLAGRIRHLYKEVVDVGDEQGNHVAKIHSNSTGACGLPHLSVAEVQLVNNPEFMDKTLPELKEIHSLLDLYLKWFKKRQIFWEWMETVLEQKEKTHRKYQQLPSEDDKMLQEFLNIIRSQNFTSKAHDKNGDKRRSKTIPRFLCDNSAQSAIGDLEIDNILLRAREKLLHTEQRNELVVGQLDDALKLLADRMSVHVISDQKSANITDPESEETSRAEMGPIPSRLSFSDVVDTLQSALPRRSDRRVKPALETQTKLCTDTPVLIARKVGKRRLFRTSKRNQIRNYTPCNLEETDDCANVFGRSRPGSSQSPPPAIPVRRYRPAFPSPTSSNSEYRLFIENIEVEGRIVGSVFEEQTTTSSRLSTGCRSVCCRHCKNLVSAPRSFFSSPCATPYPHPTVRPICRACAWHSMLPHDCECFCTSGAEVLSWDVERGRFQKKLSMPIICPCGRPRIVQRQERRTEKLEFTDSQENFPDEPVPEEIPAEPVPKEVPQEVPEEVPEPATVEKESTEEIHPCVCALPSKTPCPCDQKLYDAMKPWSKIKVAIGGGLVLLLIVWLVVFFWL